MKREVSYVIHWKSPYCYDDGGLGHDLCWSTYTDTVEVKTDKAAQVASLDDKYHGKNRCYCSQSHAFVLKIVKTLVESTPDGFSRTTVTDIPLPTWKACPCGKHYWPVLGEKACHVLVPA